MIPEGREDEGEGKKDMMMMMTGVPDDIWICINILMWHI